MSPVIKPIALPAEIESIMRSSDLRPDQLTSPQIVHERAALLVDNGVFENSAVAQDFVRMWFGVLGGIPPSQSAVRWIEEIGQLYSAKRAEQQAAAEARAAAVAHQRIIAKRDRLAKSIAAQRDTAASAIAGIPAIKEQYFQVVVGNENETHLWAGDYVTRINTAEAAAKFINEHVIPVLEAQLRDAERDLIQSYKANGLVPPSPASD